MSATSAVGNSALKHTPVKDFSVKLLRKELRKQNKLLSYHKTVLSKTNPSNHDVGGVYDSIDKINEIVTDVRRSIKILTKRKLK